MLTRALPSGLKAPPCTKPPWPVKSYPRPVLTSQMFCCRHVKNRPVSLIQRHGKAGAGFVELPSVDLVRVAVDHGLEQPDAGFHLRKVQGWPRRETLGLFPDLTVENARGKAAELNAPLAKWKADGYVGLDPGERRNGAAPTLAALRPKWPEHQLDGAVANC
jgi:hypothetical protein